ncbi:MAG: hypothetical protein R6T87_05810 [Marinobacter sp.]
MQTLQRLVNRPTRHTLALILAWRFMRGEFDDFVELLPPEMLGKDYPHGL